MVKLTMYANYIDNQMGMFLETTKENYYDLALAEFNQENLKRRSYDPDIDLYIWGNQSSEDYTNKFSIDIDTFEDKELDKDDI